MEIIDIEIEIQPGIRTKIIDWSNNCAIVGIFVELLLFLVNYPNNSLTRGGAFREPSGLSTVPCRTCLRFGGCFFLDWFPGAPFLIKNAFWEPKVLQNGSKIDSGSDLGCHFYIFQRTLILNDRTPIFHGFSCWKASGQTKSPIQMHPGTPMETCMDKSWSQGCFSSRKCASRLSKWYPNR